MGVLKRTQEVVHLSYMLVLQENWFRFTARRPQQMILRMSQGADSTQKPIYRQQLIYGHLMKQ